ncbi:integrin-linked protein kinase 1-like [Carya illinoinensis]|uniref:integrin-linked protein kinase 1-like n=1 Tax=Carya illinoinensis TaxID=32201 RepID=UPI001C727F78|nr:integrin-linked protein kinase 1-like [Carya illinoinensis]
MGKQSSLAPDRYTDDEGSVTENDEVAEGIDPGVRLMYLANGGDLEGIRELLDSGVDVNFKDIDGRSALHVAAYQVFTDVAALLLDRGVEIDPKDRWGSTVTPLPATMSEFLISVCDRLLDRKERRAYSG